MLLSRKQRLAKQAVDRKLLSLLHGAAADKLVTMKGPKSAQLLVDLLFPAILAAAPDLIKLDRRRLAAALWSFRDSNDEGLGYFFDSRHMNSGREVDRLVLYLEQHGCFAPVK